MNWYPSMDNDQKTARTEQKEIIKNINLWNHQKYTLKTNILLKPEKTDPVENKTKIIGGYLLGYLVLLCRRFCLNKSGKTL